MINSLDFDILKLLYIYASTILIPLPCKISNNFRGCIVRLEFQGNCRLEVKTITEQEIIFRNQIN